MWKISIWQKLVQAAWKTVKVNMWNVSVWQRLLLGSVKACQSKHVKHKLLAEIIQRVTMWKPGKVNVWMKFWSQFSFIQFQMVSMDSENLSFRSFPNIAFEIVSIFIKEDHQVLPLSVLLSPWQWMVSLQKDNSAWACGLSMLLSPWQWMVSLRKDNSA